MAAYADQNALPFVPAVMETAGLTCEGIARRWAVHPNLGDAPRDCFSYAKVR